MTREAKLGLAAGAVAVALLLFLGVRKSSEEMRIPPHGSVGLVRHLQCPTVVLEFRFYDYEPPDDEFWQALGVGEANAPDVIVIFPKPERAKADFEQTRVYIDTNGDGIAERVISLAQFLAEVGDDWCSAYTRIRGR